jgi:hypothetical protein
MEWLFTMIDPDSCAEQDQQKGDVWLAKKTSHPVVLLLLCNAGKLIDPAPIASQRGALQKV